MNPDFLIGSALIILAMWVAVAWLHAERQRTSSASDVSVSSTQGRLPRLGEPGTVGKNQVKQLQSFGLDDLNYADLSREQGELLLDCITYIHSVWELDLHRESDDLPPALLEKSLRIILEHDSYRERIVAWDIGVEGDENLCVPDDACHAAVKYQLSHSI